MKMHNPNRSTRALATTAACGLMATFVVGTAVQADYVGLNYRVTRDIEIEGETYYSIDLFIEVTEENDRLLMVFGDATFPLKLSALNGGFHNHPAGSHLPHESSFDAIFGDALIYDTFVTIGTDVPVANGPSTLSFDTDSFREDDIFTLDDGSWFILPLKSTTVGYQHDPLGVMIARLTVQEDQTIAGQINVIGRTENLDAIVEWSPVFAETFVFTNDTVTSTESTPITTGKWNNGNEDGDRYAFTLANIGDVNGDEFDDLAVGAPRSSATGGDNGRIEVWSGYDDALLYSIDGQPDEQLGFALDGAGDVNGDSIPDIIAGAPYNDENGSSAGKGYVFSGADGSVLMEFRGQDPGDRFGSSVAGGASLDGDNIPDYVIGAPRFKDKKGAAYVYSSDGTLLKRFKGDEKGDQCGAAVAVLKDVSRFGRVLIGSPKNDLEEKNAGLVEVFQHDGGSFDSVLTITGSNKNDRLGSSIAGLGDVDGDGLDDFGLGIPRYTPSDKKKAGRTSIYSSADGENLWNKNGSHENERMGTTLRNAGDLNCDGVPDVLVGSPRYEAFGESQAGRILAYSGGDGGKLEDLLSEQAQARLGRSFAALGNPYNYTRLALGAWRHQPDEESGMTGGFTMTTYLGCHATLDLSEPLADEGRVPGTGPGSITDHVPTGEVGELMDLLLRY